MDNNPRKITLAHGGGGRLTNQLIEELFVEAFDNETIRSRHDAAELVIPAGRTAVSTDSYVVTPLFFPGGDIGSLAIHGTINDLAMAGARPVAITCGFIIEEGLSVDVLHRVVNSMARSARECAVDIVAGDTKVVPRGKADGLYVNTTGLGTIGHGVSVVPSRIKPGDAVVVSGDIGRHGIAVMAARENLGFESSVESDSASLWPLVRDLLDDGVDLHCLRDLTRGGLSSALNELAQTAGVSIEIDESAVPVSEPVAALCEVLGLDVMNVANEGRMVVLVSPDEADRTVATLRRHVIGKQAAIVGRVAEQSTVPVTLIGRLGQRRVLPMFSGEQLPRIC
jgi:hydrogenase expression/formation protein HypE